MSRLDIAAAVLIASEGYLRSSDVKRAKVSHFVFFDVLPGPNNNNFVMLSLLQTNRSSAKSICVLQRTV